MDVHKDTLHSIVDAIADPIFVKDRRHRFVLLNDACCRLIGRPREELLGKSDYDFFPKEEADVFWQKDEEVFKTGEPNLNEEDITDAAGETHTIVTKKSRYIDSTGHPFIVGVTRDITDSKELERRQLELARSQAEREQLELFAYVASHDLREPLQSIIGFSDLLKERYSQRLDPAGANYLKRIGDAAERMSGLIDDLLKFSKVIKREELFESVDLSKVISDILDDYEYLIRKVGANVQVGRLPAIHGDRTQIHQLFQNLLSNALKFHPQGRSPEVSVSAKDQKDGRIEVMVRDNGIGIDPKYWQRIFRPFERLHGRTEYEGSGVGLAICQKIAYHHGGEIRLQSQPGDGSIFSVVLQRARRPA